MSRPRFQFGLRLAILLITLVCVASAWIGWTQYKARLDKIHDSEPRIGDEPGSTTMPKAVGGDQPTESDK